LVVSVPDLSKTPEGQSQPANIQALVQRVSALWNAAVDIPANTPGVGPLIFLKRLTGTAIYTEDTFRLLNQVAANPAAFGFSHGVNVSWCGFGELLDPNPDHWVFYNFIHPTSQGHMMIANDTLANARRF
jgi:phospholipase/lecithinase/hemolysin